MRLNNSTILVTGGTGSFGHHFVERLLTDGAPRSITIFSRDEKKQFDMRRQFQSPVLKFIIGDVRDRDAVFGVMKGVDFVFHAAALKQVPNCEFFPFEAIKTNIIGTKNVLDAAESEKVEKVVVLSTDKAVYPINAMGMTKALLEKLMLAKARTAAGKTAFCGVRYGNVMFSRGSVLPLFMEQITKNEPLTVTNPDMTRYMLPLPIAIELVLHAIEHGHNGDMLVRKSPASTMGTAAQAMVNLFGHKAGIKIIGIREGEKMHETLVTQEDLMKADVSEHYYIIKNLSSLDYEQYFSKGKVNCFPKEGYTSENTRRLNLKETEELILSLREIQEQMNAKA
jgi:UDP-glucose 4-epimerase